MSTVVGSTVPIGSIPVGGAKGKKHRCTIVAALMGIESVTRTWELASNEYTRKKLRKLFAVDWRVAVNYARKKSEHAVEITVVVEGHVVDDIDRTTASLEGVIKI